MFESNFSHLLLSIFDFYMNRQSNQKEMVVCIYHLKTEKLANDYMNLVNRLKEKTADKLLVVS